MKRSPMTMNADMRDSHRVSFRFWALAQPKNAAGILHNRRACSALQGIGGRATNKQSAKSPTIALLATIEKGKTCPSLPNFRWQLIKWAKPLLLHMKMVCAHIIGTDHFLFNVAGVVLFFYIVLIIIEPV